MFSLDKMKTTPKVNVKKIKKNQFLTTANEIDVDGCHFFFVFDIETKMATMMMMMMMKKKYEKFAGLNHILFSHNQHQHQQNINKSYS